MSKRSLQPILEQTRLLHEALSDLWDDLPAPDSPRSLLVAGFCEIVRQRVTRKAGETRHVEARRADLAPAD